MVFSCKLFLQYNSLLKSILTVKFSEFYKIDKTVFRTRNRILPAIRRSLICYLPMLLRE